MRFTQTFIEYQLIEAVIEDDHEAAVEVAKRMTPRERQDLADYLDTAVELLGMKYDD